MTVPSNAGETPPGWPVQPLFTEADDDWHEHSPHWWETETAWFGFSVPERRMGGAIYLQSLGTQQACNGGAWIWDDSAPGHLYNSHRMGVPWPDRGSLNDSVCPLGLTITTLEPLTTYRTTYTDPGRLELDLVHEGTVPVHTFPKGAWPYWNSSHFDQPMHTVGTMVLHGEEIAVDCFTIRDRSWGPRPAGPTPPDKKLPAGTVQWNEKTPRAHHPYSVGYMFATQDGPEAWMAATSPWLHDDGRATDAMEPGAGYLVRAGVYAPLVEARRETTLDPAHHWVTTVRIEATDVLGRELEVHGELVARCGDQERDGVGLFHWTWTGGCEGWGEDQTWGPPGWLEALDGVTF
jgi:hypothetical protein